MYVLLEVIVPVLTVFVGAMIVTVALRWLGVQLQRKEWVLLWRGHEVKVVDQLGREELWIDGERVAHHINLMSFAVTLAAEVRGVELLASLHFDPLGRPRVHIFADGTYIGGDPLIATGSHHVVAAALPRSDESVDADALREAHREVEALLDANRRARTNRSTHSGD